MRFLKLCLLVLIFSQCQSYKEGSTSMMDATYKFVKAIHTKDSKLYRRVANEDSLHNSLKKIFEGDTILDQLTAKDVYFYRYAPWKIRSQDLDALIKSEFPFQQMSFKVVSQSPQRGVFLVETVTKYSADTLEITVDKFKSRWKVTAAISK